MLLLPSVTVNVTINGVCAPPAVAPGLLHVCANWKLELVLLKSCDAVPPD